MNFKVIEKRPNGSRVASWDFDELEEALERIGDEAQVNVNSSSNSENTFHLFEIKEVERTFILTPRRVSGINEVTYENSAFRVSA